jgi:hypothetical protein
MLFVVNSIKILDKYVVQHKNMLYICNVFFMVLDLRLTKRLGCRETTFLVLINSTK